MAIKMKKTGSKSSSGSSVVLVSGLKSSEILAR